ncbi:ABC transporter ATP-binding protein [Bacillus fonticola]|uniref:ABC transporter ATP-binding protein n=1 Tax=Bacillus fonticola TaxID=2728853 RepID=UPI001473AE07|nr:ABC transporter ATP-binding protein [Bacillus fonticola]
MTTSPLLEVDALEVRFRSEEGIVSSVNGVSFAIKEGETVAVVGESGCGKSVTSLSILGLIPDNGEISSGAIRFNGLDLLGLKKRDLRKLRGNDISMIFQEPMTSLNPVFTIGNQVSEVLRLHQKLNRSQALEKSIEMLELVGIPDAEKVVKRFPHQLSGGMRQRVMIAMALSCNPKLLIADEPTTALDVTIQAQILQLMKRLKEDFQTGVMMITHDLGVVAEIADRVVVMYAGEVVEQGTVEEVFHKPQHPYTRGLLASIPKVDAVVDELGTIAGSVPSPRNWPTGCKFHPRCPLATDVCREKSPVMEATSETHENRCWNT